MMFYHSIIENYILFKYDFIEDFTNNILNFPEKFRRSLSVKCKLIEPTETTFITGWV